MHSIWRTSVVSRPFWVIQSFRLDVMLCGWGAETWVAHLHRVCVCICVCSIRSPVAAELPKQFRQDAMLVLESWNFHNSRSVQTIGIIALKDLNTQTPSLSISSLIFHSPLDLATSGQDDYEKRFPELIISSEENAYVLVWRIRLKTTSDHQPTHSQPTNSDCIVLLRATTMSTISESHTHTHHKSSLNT